MNTASSINILIETKITFTHSRSELNSAVQSKLLICLHGNVIHQTVCHSVLLCFLITTLASVIEVKNSDFKAFSWQLPHLLFEKFKKRLSWLHVT